MKGMKILCASEASTAICSSTDQTSAWASTKTLPSNLCISHPPPLNPLPYHQFRNNHKISFDKAVSDKSNDLNNKRKKKKESPTPANNSSLKPMYIFTRKSTCSDIKDADTGNDKIQCSNHQVVVLKVSLHCKGCEEKVRKHLSRMEGVTSFSIDSAAKKVTVVGDVTPLGVLASVSKVKTAQFWTTDK